MECPDTGLGVEFVEGVGAVKGLDKGPLKVKSVHW